MQVAYALEAATRVGDAESSPVTSKTGEGERMNFRRVEAVDVADAGNLINKSQQQPTDVRRHSRSSDEMKALDRSELNAFVDDSWSFTDKSLENRGDAGRRRPTNNTSESSDSLHERQPTEARRKRNHEQDF